MDVCEDKRINLAVDFRLTEEPKNKLNQKKLKGTCREKNGGK